jgi:hypothetical protein
VSALLLHVAWGLLLTYPGYLWSAIYGNLEGLWAPRKEDTGDTIETAMLTLSFLSSQSFWNITIQAYNLQGQMILLERICPVQEEGLKDTNSRVIPRD